MTIDTAKAMCPGATRANIAANLPLILKALEECGLNDAQMQLMAVATIRAETSGFKPISEGISRFNTALPTGAPFALYDPGTRIGRNLGNTEPGDGARFKGRGFIQLTGRNNYTKFGPIVGVDLLADPEQANDPVIAAKLLAAFLKAAENRIRTALGMRNFEDARRAVNGGTHGLAVFTEAYLAGERLTNAPPVIT